MVINYPPKGGKWWFSVLTGHSRWVYWAMVWKEKWGKMGGNEENWGRIGQKLGMQGGCRVRMQSMGPLSECCLFSHMDHMHPYRGVSYIPLKVVRDPQRGWVSAGWLSNFSLVSTFSPISPDFSNFFSPLSPISPQFPHFPLFPHISSGTLSGTLLLAVWAL